MSKNYLGSSAVYKSETAKLSFDDSLRTVTRKGGKTIVRLTSYVNYEQLIRLFCISPDRVFAYLEETGYKYDHATGHVSSVSRGVVVLQEGDTDDIDVAVRIASTKAKAKAYRQFGRLIDRITNDLNDSYSNAVQSSKLYHELYDEELRALDRCIKTGYCDPRRG